MPVYYSHIQTAKEILGLYEGREPFHHFIKGYFKEYKKFGSRDRKQISHLCYTFFRLGKSLPGHSFEERLVAALFLTHDRPGSYLELLQPEWYHEQQKNPELTSKLDFIQHHDPDFESSDIFPFSNPLSEGIDNRKFILSHLNQPHVYLRARPGKLKALLNRVHELPGFLFAEGNCLAFENNSSLEKVVDINKEAVIQDRSSQAIENFLPVFDNNKRPSIWDACAASGGKSILAADHYGSPELTVSDKRESILINLQHRLRSAGIPVKHRFTVDLTDPGILRTSRDLSDPDNLVSGSDIRAGGRERTNTKYDLVIADVPCSGSGTWGRTPENLVYFEGKKIGEYQDLQKSILSNLVHSVKPGGWLLYITCSVFRQENEEVISSVISTDQFELSRQGVIAGYENRADTMFASLWRNKS